MQSRTEFAKILAEKMKTSSLKIESETKLQTENARFHSFQYWIPSSDWKNPQTTIVFQGTDYKKFQKPPKPRPDHILDDRQSDSLSWFQKMGQNLNNNFRVEDLKKAFRLLAHQLHPDKPHGSAQQFMLLKKNYDLLMRVFG